MSGPDATARRALFVMLLIMLVLVLAVFRPLASPLILAGVLAMVLWPLQQWLARRLRGRRGAAAGTLVALVVALVLGPVVGMSAFVVTETAQAAQFVSDTVKSEGTRGLIAKLPDSVERQLNRALAEVEIDSSQVSRVIQQQLSKAGGSAATAVGAAVSATGSLLFQGAILVIALFFFLTNQQGIIRWLDEASPLRRGQTRELFGEFVRVCKSIIVSTAATAFVQAVAALVGYLVAGVPFPVFFFLLTFVVAFIPAVGAASVCLLAAAIQFVTGHSWAALFLAAYALFVVGLVDNVVKPLLMKGDVGMHGAVVLFALLGGLATFGGIGLVIGPLAVALFLAMLRIYHRDYGPERTDRPAPDEPGDAAPRPAAPYPVASEKASDPSVH